MATEILSAGYKSSVFPHTAATTAKLFYIAQSMLWMAMNSALADVDNVFVYAAEMLRVPKTAGEAWTPGEKIYYVTATGAFTTTASTNTLAGIVNEPALSADTEGVIDFMPAAVVNA